MIQKDFCQKIIDTAIVAAAKKVDGIEVTVTASDIATTRFANNSVTQNQSPDTESVSVRVLIDGRQARLSTDQTSPQSIKELVDETIAAAKLLEKDPDLLPLPNSDQHISNCPNRFDMVTAEIRPQDRANAVKEMIEVAKSSNLIGAGTYSSGSQVIAIGNSNGLFRFHRESSAEASVTIRIQEASGWAKAQSPKAKDIDAAHLAQRASEKALRGLKQTEVPPGQYTVILEPAAVLDLFCFLLYDFTGTSHLDKLSSLLDKVGKRVFGENITIKDDCLHPLQSGAPFDGEGLNRESVKIVENGILKNLVYGRRSAKKAGVLLTGHGLQEPSSLGEYPENLVVSGGDTPLEKMIASTNYGVLVSRVWYVREVDPKSLLVTGLTQDGTFLIKAGELMGGLKNMRFNVSIHEILNKVLSIGPAVRAAGEEGAPAIVPPMTIADFNFTEHSLF